MTLRRNQLSLKELEHHETPPICLTPLFLRPSPRARTFNTSGNVQKERSYLSTMIRARRISGAAQLVLATSLFLAPYQTKADNTRRRKTSIFFLILVVIRLNIMSLQKNNQFYEKSINSIVPPRLAC